MRLNKDWINVGPADQLTLGLPDGFKSRMHTVVFGGLTIHLADRFDQICLKLFATVDQGYDSKHHADLKNLSPTKEELNQARRWCMTQDESEGFTTELNAVISKWGS